jgi:hypothetical protein
MKEGSGSFLKKRTKKLFPSCRFSAVARGPQWCRSKRGKVFLLLFLQKKKSLS